MKQTAVDFLYSQLEGIREDYKQKIIVAEQSIGDRAEALRIAKEIEKENMIDFLQSVFRMEGFDYEKCYKEFSLRLKYKMKIKKIGNSNQWLCDVGGFSYVRIEIEFLDKPNLVVWHLTNDKDFREGDTGPSHDELEELFLGGVRNNFQPSQLNMDFFTKEQEILLGDNQNVLKENLTYTEAAKKEEMIFNSTILKPKKEAPEEIDKKLWTEAFSSLFPNWTNGDILESIEKSQIEAFIKGVKSESFYHKNKYDEVFNWLAKDGFLTHNKRQLQEEFYYEKFKKK